MYRAFGVKRVHFNRYIKNLHMRSELAFFGGIFWRHFSVAFFSNNQSQFMPPPTMNPTTPTPNSRDQRDQKLFEKRPKIVRKTTKNCSKNDLKLFEKRPKIVRKTT
jgi:hypothetical protein